MARKTTTPISIGFKRRKVFIDTSGWEAVERKDDKYHPKGSPYYADLLRSGTQLLTSDYVLDETMTRLLYDAGVDVAEKCWNRIKEAEKTGRLAVLSVDASIRDEAFEILKQYGDQKISFTDCTSAVLAKREQVDEIFTFDHHFWTLGLIIQPIP